jgi:ferredoxin
MKKNMNRRDAIILAAGAACSFAAHPLSASFKPHVYPSRCVGCRDCVRICPVKGAIVMVRGKSVVIDDLCIACQKCVFICSYRAVR